MKSKTSAPRPKVQNYMTRSPHCVGKWVELSEALSMMRELEVRHLPVEENGLLVGSLSRRNLMAALASPMAKTLTIGDIMEPDPYLVAPDADLAEVVEAMASDRIGSAIVTLDEKVVGIFTTVDACRALHEILDDIY